MLKEADDLVLLMKQKIDQILANDEKLQNFLKWVQQKSNSIQAPYKPAAIRAFYFELGSDLSFEIFWNFDREFAITRFLSLDFSLKFNFESIISVNYYIERMIGFEHMISLEESLEESYILDSELHLKLQELKEQLPDIPPENRDNLKKWWNTNSQAWIHKFQRLIIEYRNICHDWKFNADQQILLENYYDANLLLVNCLKECHLTRSVREEIEQTLLLPIQKN